MINIFSNNNPKPEQLVNTVGKYIFKNLDGSINFKKSSSMYDIWTVVLYQIPYELIEKYNLKENTDVNEMILNINVTTYNNKIRLNIIEETPEELTIGYKTFDINRFKSKYRNQWLKKILEATEFFIQDKLQKKYEDYDFLF